MSNGIKRLFRQSGVIPLIDDKIVLITARKSDRWIIPKGYVEKGMTAADSAAKEAYEEAGVIGKVHHDEIGTYRFRKWGQLYAVQVFPLYIETMLDEWDEMHMRRRLVVSVEEAIDMLYHEELRRVIAGYFQARSS